MTKEEIQAAIDGMTFYMSISAIEKQLKMPATTLQKTLKGERDLPVKWIKPLQNFFGIKTDAPVVEVKKEPVVVAPAAPAKKKSYTDYLRMSGKEIKARWDDIKKCKFTPGQVSALYDKSKK